VKIWAYKNASLYANLNQTHTSSLNLFHNVWLDEISGIIITSDNSTVITCARDNKILKWKLSDHRDPITISKDEKSPITSISLSDDETFFATGSVNKEIKLWNLETGKLIQTISDAHEGRKVYFLLIFTDVIGTLTFSSVNELVSGGGDEHIFFWDVFEAKRTGQINYAHKCNSFSFL
jgi:WD40 repeat protein